MNLIKLSNNKFTNKNISNNIPYTDSNKNISLTTISKENIIKLYCHNNTKNGLYNYAQKLSQPFEQVSQSTYKAIVHGYSYYITGMIFISQPTKLIIDFYNKQTNKTINVLTINITKQNYYFYISELIEKKNQVVIGVMIVIYYVKLILMEVIHILIVLNFIYLIGFIK